MTEPLIIHNFTKTSEGHGLNMRQWLQEELERLYAGACPDNPCVVNPFTVLKGAITVLQTADDAQDLILADHETRIDALENP